MLFRPVKKKHTHTQKKKIVTVFTWKVSDLLSGDIQKLNWDCQEGCDNNSENVKERSDFMDGSY